MLMNPERFFPSVAEKFISECGPLLDERGLFTLSVTCYLVESQGKRYLVDTGLGNRRRPGMPRGHLDETLVGAGIAAGEINTVIHTHLHIDHVGWNTVDDEAGEKQLFFPNATFWIQQNEWGLLDGAPATWKTPITPSCASASSRSPTLAEIKFFNGETAIDKNLTIVSTPGHTPGHVSVGIYSQGERAILVGDASHHPIQLIHPDWAPAADIDPVSINRDARTALRREHRGQTAVGGRTLDVSGGWQARAARWKARVPRDLADNLAWPRPPT